MKQLSLTTLTFLLFLSSFLNAEAIKIDMHGVDTQINDLHPKMGIGIGMSPEPKERTLHKPFIKKDIYTVEEIRMWRKELKDQVITLKGSITKVSHSIMNRDWVHVVDQLNKEKKLTDDLVFTAAHTTIKAGDNVLAKGKVVIDKDFGYGYFYKVIIEDAHFEVK